MKEEKFGKIVEIITKDFYYFDKDYFMKRQYIKIILLDYDGDITTR